MVSKIFAEKVSSDQPRTLGGRSSCRDAQDSTLLFEAVAPHLVASLPHGHFPNAGSESAESSFFGGFLMLPPTTTSP
jgi:hypothetical protein